jgi:hypothetical protein
MQPLQHRFSLRYGEESKVSMLKKLTIFATLVMLCAACTGSPTPFELPTVAVLPSLTSTIANNSAPTAESTEAVFAFTVAPQFEVAATLTLPVPTEQLQVWYSTDITPIYDCPELTCNVLTSFPAGVQLIVIRTENGWHEILLSRQSGRYVESRLTSQATPQPSTATAAAIQLVQQGQETNPSLGSNPIQGGPPTADLTNLPPMLGTTVVRTSPQPTQPLPTAPPFTPQTTNVNNPPQITSLPPGMTAAPTATPATIAPPPLTSFPTPTFELPLITSVPVTPSATPRDAPPGVDPNLPTATPFVPRPPGT